MGFCSTDSHVKTKRPSNLGSPISPQIYLACKRILSIALHNLPDNIYYNNTFKIKYTLFLRKVLKNVCSIYTKKPQIQKLAIIVCSLKIWTEWRSVIIHIMF
jgi:hypothetical protein